MGFGFNNLHIHRAESPRILQGARSGVEHMTSNATVAQYKNQQRRDRDKARRDRLTPEQREEMNAHRRAARQNKSNKERNASQRAARKNLTPKKRQKINALGRAANKNKPDEE
jgi:Spy/CpxP family protein refolding chaperone